MIIGYARVSTEEQKLDLQIQALEGVGCNHIFKDHGQSGKGFEREGLEAALARLKPGGTLVVWRLDRLGRSLSGLVSLIDLLGKRQVHFRSVMENIDTSTSGGRLMFHMMAALAEFERAVISERTRAGINAARANGKHLGRPRSLTANQIEKAWHALHHQGQCLLEVAETMSVSTRTLRRTLRESGRDVPPDDKSAAHAFAARVRLSQPGLMREKRTSASASTKRRTRRLPARAG